MPARRIAPLWAVCGAGVISDRRARWDVFERTRRCALMLAIISHSAALVCASTSKAWSCSG
eukprot:6699568-Prymnesium_polylepis.1